MENQEDDTTPFNSKKLHFSYLNKLFTRVSTVFAQLSTKIDDLHEEYSERRDITKKATPLSFKGRQKKWKQQKVRGFTLFFRDAYESVIEENPGYSVLDVMKELRGDWEDPLYNETRNMYNYLAWEYNRDLEIRLKKEFEM